MLVLLFTLLNTILAASLPIFTVSCPEGLDQSIGESFVHHLASCGMFGDDGPDLLDTFAKSPFIVDDAQVSCISTSSIWVGQNVKRTDRFLLIKEPLNVELQLFTHFGRQVDEETGKPVSPRSFFPVAIRVTLIKVQDIDHFQQNSYLDRRGLPFTPPEGDNGFE